MDEPVHFEIVYTDECLEARGGLPVIGRLLADTDLKSAFDELSVSGYKQPTIGHGDVVLSFIGLCCLARPDFTAIEDEASGQMLRLSFGLDALPSEETLRQRLDAIATDPSAPARPIIQDANTALITTHAPTITPCLSVQEEQWMPLDSDVSCFDNSQTQKQGVGRTYKGEDGFAPNFAHLGEEGYQINVELREGTQHCQKGTPAFLEEAIERSRSMLDARGGKESESRLLVRLDAGNDDVENVRVCRSHPGTDWLIKRNLRQESVEDWRRFIKDHGDCERPREGKEIWRGDCWLERDGRWERVVFEMTERTSTPDGQQLLSANIDLNTWWTSLPKSKASVDTVIQLYRDHATSEQFHAELKSDMDLERLPSGKFATNALALELGMLAYNALRITGQRSLELNETLPAEDQAPVKRDTQNEPRAKRRRLRRVIQDLMYLPVKLTRSGRRWCLHLSSAAMWSSVCGALYEHLLRLNPG